MGTEILSTGVILSQNRYFCDILRGAMADQQRRTEPYNSPPNVEAPQWVRWLFAEDQRPWTVYFIFLALTTTLAVSLVLFTDFETTTKTVYTVPAGGGEPVPQSEEKTTALPVLAMITAVTAGGWVLLPLTFLWDQRTKSIDARREEIAKRQDEQREETKAKTDHIRSIATAMQERIFTAIDHYYGPHWYSIGMVVHWASKIVEKGSSDAPAQDPAMTCLLYRIACHESQVLRIQEHGAVLVLMSRKAEDQVLQANKAFHDAIRDGFGEARSAELTLGGAVRAVQGAPADRSEGQALITLHDFEEKRRTEKGLDEACAELEGHFADPSKLHGLIKAGNEARKRYGDHLSLVFDEWYRFQALRIERATQQ